MDEAIATEAPTEPEVPVHLARGWRWTLGIAWAAVMSAVGLIADTGVSLGGPPFWLVTWVLPFVLPTLTLVALLRDWRHALTLSFVSAGSLLLVGLVDLVVAPAMGVAELVMAFAALLISLAGLAGRVPQGTAAPITA